MILLPQVERWFFALNRDAMASVTGAIDLLEMEGRRWAARWSTK